MSAAENCEIVKYIRRGRKSLDISQKLKRDYCSVKRFFADSKYTGCSADKGTMRKVMQDKYSRLREQLLKCHCKAATRYLYQLVPPESHQGLGSSRSLHLCINLLFGNP